MLPTILLSGMERQQETQHLLNIFNFFSVTALKRVLEEHRNIGNILNFIYVNGGG